MPAPPSRPTRRVFLAGVAAAGLAACTKDAVTGAPAGGPATSAAIGADVTSPPPTVGPATSRPATTSGPPSTSSTSTTRPADPTSSTTTANPRGPATFFTTGPASKQNVALTFHTDGDLAIDQRLLDILAEHRAVATCFVVGQWLDANPTWAGKLTDAGHELANHTYTHPSFAQLTAAAMATEISRCRDSLQRHTGRPGRFFRPSGTDDGTSPPGAAVMQAATDAGYPYVAGWDVEPSDFKDPGATLVRDRVLAGVRPGSIASLHFGHRGTVEALPAILDGLAARGLQPVTLSTLLA